MARLENKVAIITGSSSGIGRAIALRYAREGAKVVCADLAPESRAKDPDEHVGPTHEVIRQAGGEAIFQQTDVGDSSQVEGLVKSAVEEFGRLDIMVNNAGIGVAGRQPAPLHLTDEDFWDLTMRVNAKSVFLGCKYAMAQMMQQEPHPSGDRGWVINTASIAGLVAIENTPSYCASKGAVTSLTRQAALDYAPHRIHVNAICPGSLVEESHGDAMTQLGHRHPLGGLGKPDDIARVAVVLASEDAHWMTGVSLLVDGGYTRWSRSYDWVQMMIAGVINPTTD